MIILKNNELEAGNGQKGVKEVEEEHNRERFLIWEDSR